MVSQAVKYLSWLTPAIVIWFALVFEWIPGLRTTTNDGHRVVLWAPVIAVIAIGLYALISVIYGVLTFNDCQMASDELRKEIVEAKADLRKKGIDTS